MEVSQYPKKNSPSGARYANCHCWPLPLPGLPGLLLTSSKAPFGSATLTAGQIDLPTIRGSGKLLLSLALMDSRNHTLHLLRQFQQSLEAGGFSVPRLPILNPPLWEVGHLGWFQERWIGRNLLRHQGAECDPGAACLPSIEPNADRWWDSSQVAHEAAGRWTCPVWRAAAPICCKPLKAA